LRRQRQPALYDPLPDRGERKAEASRAAYDPAMTIRSPFVTQPPLRNPVGRPCIGRVAMTNAERQSRYRKLSKKRRRARNVEWYTPPGIIALVVAVMGAIDTDPASCAIANETVGAKVFHTLDARRARAAMGGPRLSEPALFENLQFRRQACRRDGGWTGDGIHPADG
jgi:hypothetical protein